MPPPEVALVRPLRQVASFGCLRRNSPLIMLGRYPGCYPARFWRGDGCLFLPEVPDFIGAG